MLAFPLRARIRTGQTRNTDLSILSRREYCTRTSNLQSCGNKVFCRVHISRLFVLILALSGRETEKPSACTSIPFAQQMLIIIYNITTDKLQPKCVSIKSFQVQNLNQPKILLIKPGALACGWHAPGFLKLFLCGCLYVCLYVCPPPRLYINN